MNKKSPEFRHSFTSSSDCFRFFIRASLLTVGMSLSLLGVERVLANSLTPAENINIGNGTDTILASISRTEFLADYPPGTTLCFSDRSVENKVEIVDFNQSFQVVDFVYLDGGYRGQKGSADYSTFVRNAYPCSY